MPAHPHPELLTALTAAVSATVERAGAFDEELLEQEVLIGDRGTQAAVDDLVDEALEALRELSASCRELSIGLAGTDVAEQRPARDRHPVWEGR